MMAPTIRAFRMFATVIAVACAAVAVSCSDKTNITSTEGENGFDRISLRKHPTGINEFTSTPKYSVSLHSTSTRNMNDSNAIYISKNRDTLIYVYNTYYDDVNSRMVKNGYCKLFNFGGMNQYLYVVSNVNDTDLSIRISNPRRYSISAVFYFPIPLPLGNYRLSVKPKEEELGDQEYDQNFSLPLK